MESELHKQLKSKAVNYLWDKGYWIVRAEVNCGYYGIYDVWGINPEHKTIGIECKVSKSDFKNNYWKEKKLERGIPEIKWKINGVETDRIAAEAVAPLDIVPANENYILCPSGLLFPDQINSIYGLLWFNGKRLVNKKKSQVIEMSDKNKLMVLMNFLSSKANNISL